MSKCTLHHAHSHHLDLQSFKILPNPKCLRTLELMLKRLWHFEPVLGLSLTHGMNQIAHTAYRSQKITDEDNILFSHVALFTSLMSFSSKLKKILSNYCHVALFTSLMSVSSKLKKILSNYCCQ